MEFYAATARDNIPPMDMQMFDTISLVVKEMPNLVFDSTEREWDTCKNQVTCHLICRALALHFPLVVHDGYFTQGYQHSWLVPHSGLSIIDAYPVAGGVPFIVANNRASPWSRLYIKSDEFSNKLITDQFCKRLKLTEQVVKKTIGTLSRN